MGTQNKAEDGVPAARLEFARRLRELRLPRGFRTARSLARTLDIDENRYTRYERAEVEPDLAMIRLICETLQVTPNDLLGATGQIEPGLAPSPDGAAGNSAAKPGQSRNSGIPTAAWLLAEAATELKGALGAPRGLPDERPLPLASMAETGKLYRALMEQPFEAISDLLSDRDIAALEPLAARSLKQRIDAFVALVKTQP